MRRHRTRRGKTQLRLFQPRVERPEWKAVSPVRKQTVISLLAELFRKGVGPIADNVEQAREKTDD